MCTITTSSTTTIIIVVIIIMNCYNFEGEVTAPKQAGSCEVRGCELYMPHCQCIFLAGLCFERLHGEGF